MGSYQVTTTGGPYQVDTEDAAPEKTLEGFGKNLVSDVEGTGKALFGPGGLGNQLMDHPIDTAMNTVKGLPGAIVNEGKRIGAGELLTGHPINAAEKFGNAMYDKPVSTALDVLPAVGAAGKAIGFGGDAAKGAEIASEAAPVAEDVAGSLSNASTAASAAKGEAPELVGMGGGVPGKSATMEAAEDFAKNPPPATPPPSAPISPTTGIVDDLKNYIGPKFEGAKGKLGDIYAKQAAQPGWSNQLGDYLQGKSQMMMNQEFGATPFQARQAGHDVMRAIGQYGLDNYDATNTLRGMRAQNAKLLNAAGDTIGKLRREADSLRDPVQTPVDVLQEVRNRLDPKYARGAYSGQAGHYAKALEDVEDSAPTFEGAAKTATKLNQAANEAAKIKQPHGPYTDVANAISDINNERIKTLLGSQKAAQYEQALRDFGVNKKIGSFLERKAGGEVKRIGPGSFTSNMIQKGMDELGYKVGARALNKTSTAVLRNPAVSKTLPSLFKQFINDVELPEPEAMAEGGIVGLNDFLSSKYANQKEK